MRGEERAGLHSDGLVERSCCMFFIICAIAMDQSVYRQPSCFDPDHGPRTNFSWDKACISDRMAMQMNRSSFRAGAMSSSRSMMPRAANSRRSLVVQARQNMAGERIWLDVVWLEDKASPEAALFFFIAQSSAMDGVFDPLERISLLQPRSHLALSHFHRRRWSFWHQGWYDELFHIRWTLHPRHRDCD
jgi:hypothetical protein